MSPKFIDYVMRIRLPIILFVGIAAFALTYYTSRAERDGVGYTPEQPIAYSHKLHAGEMQIDCEYCHTGVAKTRHASVPAASICMNCHTLARADRPDIRLLADYYKRNEVIPWKRVHRVPDYAYFSHVSHVGKGMECESCHGLMEETVKVSQVNAFTMGACLTCHRNAQEQLPYLENVQNGPDNCYACHR